MAALGLQTVIHGKLYTYSELKCRCEDCRAANRNNRRTQRARGVSYVKVPREQRRNCLICGTALNVHPLRACWRDVG